MHLDADPSEATRVTAPQPAAGGSAPARSTRMDPAHERALVAQAAIDGEAFGELYDYYLPRIYGFVHRRVRERSVTEDLTAATFERGLAALRGGRFRNDSFGGWLYRVAANLVIDHVRASRRLHAVDDVDALDPAPDGLAAAIERDEVRRAMDRLPDGHRRVLALRFFDDLESDEASAVLGCSRRTFAVKLHRAIAALRETLAADATEGLEVSDVA
ncbi:MAG: sigma-70 family RNA polymerase sigma factor [Chloroflexota bacterium]|jgi:RNA polymerase sigma-70 factor (ECF subfamily)|nr:sigma-70 family RNA polymerase sigma factor [Chloroflexota bacterium]